MTPIKNSVRYTVVAVSLVYTAVLFLSGVELDTFAKQFLALLPTLFALGVVAYDRWVWKWALGRKFHQRPQIDGLWRVTLTPNPESHIPPDGNRGPIEAYAVIDQTYWSISVAQFTEQSESYSLTSTFIARGQTNMKTLSFLYDNTPRYEHRKRSPRHSGACEISVPTGQPTAMTGLYFTDRFTQGEMVLELVDRTTNYRDFASAKAHADRTP